MESECRKEITELHQFFVDWFRGRIDADAFDRFSGVLAKGFRIITPDGTRTDREELLALIRQMHATVDTEFSIWIENCETMPLSKSLCLVTYEEWQRRSGLTRGRLSSVLFHRKKGTPNEVEWVHVHEVWLPA